MHPRSAAKQSGQQRYSTGQPCKNGHVAERNTATGKCVECKFPSAGKHREYNLRWRDRYPGRDQEVKYRFRYGVELSQIRAKPERCEICERPHNKIVYDHCHVGGQFRGWLCDPCNIVLGNVKDSPTLLRKMASYLESHSPK